MTKLNIEDLITDGIEYKRKNYTPIHTHEELYGKLSCLLHDMVGKLSNEQEVKEEILHIIIDCCYALECLYPKDFERSVPSNKKQIQAEIDLSITKGLLQEILDLYSNTTLEKVVQKGQKPRRLVYLPPELINSLFSLFN
jgi:hypothetical protein